MKIAIIDSGYKSYSFEKQLFEEAGYELSIFPGYDGDPSLKLEFAREATGILVRHTLINEDFLSSMKNLKAVVRLGVGYDNIDVEACTKAGVKVANAQGYGNHSVSDHALAMMFSCCRGLWNTRKQVLEGFGAPPLAEVFELHDKTLGIVGLGRIGSEFCRKARPLFRKVIASDPYKSESHFQQMGAIPVSLDELLGTSHVISLHCNLTQETKKLIGHSAFQKMKNKPVLLNTSRGEVIDEKALKEALIKEMIHSAGIDVYENEPAGEAQLEIIDHPRTICTGHYAWYSDASSVELQRRAARNLLDLLRGNYVEDCPNPD